MLQLKTAANRVRKDGRGGIWTVPTTAVSRITILRFVKTLKTLIKQINETKELLHTFDNVSERGTPPPILVNFHGRPCFS